MSAVLSNQSVEVIINKNLTEYREEVMTRALLMIRWAILNSGITSGKFRFNLMDTKNLSFAGEAGPFLRFVPTNIAIALQVNVKTGKRSDSAIGGTLVIPSHINRADFIRCGKEIIDSQNNLEWKDIFAEIPPLPAPPKYTPTPLPVPSHVKIKTTSVESVNNTLDKKIDRDVSLVSTLAKNNPNCVFKGAGISKVISSLVSDEPSNRIPVTGLFRHLIKLKYVRSIGAGMYQVEESFLHKHGIQVPNFVQKTSVERAIKVVAPQSKQKVDGDLAQGADDLETTGNTSTQTTSNVEEKSKETGSGSDDTTSSLMDLISQREKIDSKLFLMKKQLEENLAFAKSQVVQAERKLEEFNAQVERFMKGA